MKKTIEIILFMTLLITFLFLSIIGCCYAVKEINNERYNETPTISDEMPTISEIKERSKKYILDVWKKSGIELEFITQEIINEDTLVYYFEITKPDFIYVNDYIKYIKTVYNLQDICILSYKSWKFDKVIFSNYGEIEALLEMEDEKIK